MSSIKTSASDLLDGTLGACLACGKETSGVEPDARNYTCPFCGENQVFGLEELLFMGEIEFDGE